MEGMFLTSSHRGRTGRGDRKYGMALQDLPTSNDSLPPGSFHPLPVSQSSKTLSPAGTVSLQTTAHSLHLSSAMGSQSTPETRTMVLPALLHKVSFAPTIASASLDAEDYTQASCPSLMCDSFRYDF